MDNKKYIGGIMALTTFIVFMAAGEIMSPNQKAYYCQSSDTICVGDRLSSTGRTCYFTVNDSTKSKLCDVSWVEYSAIAATLETQVGVYGNGCLHKCPVIGGNVESYTTCVCDNGKYAYMGELI